MGTREEVRHAAASNGAGHKPSPKLAKLTRPQASNAVLRHRLFTRLDEAQERPLVWIHGPPGAGKTTLIASYLSAKNRPGIWYQIDSGDGDPASFFYYLGLAAAAKAPRKRRPMPLLTPEYLLDIEGFTRRFFRELCSRLGDTAVLVFDNYQEVAAPPVFHKVIACAVSELASGARVIVLSRREPPPEYARHVANSLIAQIGWEDLRLSLDETRLIATARQPVHAELFQTLHEQSDGWAAGLVLMLPRRRDVALPSLNTELAVRASLFTAIVLRQTYREDIPHLARQLADMLRHDLDSNYKLLAARGIFFYGAYSGDFVLTDQVASYTEAAFYAPGASALNRAWYAARLGFALRYVRGSREKARAWFLKAREIVREHGLRFVEAPIAIFWGRPKKSSVRLRTSSVSWGWQRHT